MGLSGAKLERIKNCAGRSLSGNFERSVSRQPHAFIEKRGKDMFSLTVLCSLLFEVLYDKVRFPVLVMVCNRDKIYSLYAYTQGEHRGCSRWLFRISFEKLLISFLSSYS